MDPSQVSAILKTVLATARVNLEAALPTLSGKYKSYIISSTLYD